MSERPVPRFFLILVVATALLLGLIVFPIASELILAAVLAAILWPVQAWLARRLGGHRGAAAGLLTIGTIVLIAGPFMTLVAFVIRDGGDGVAYIAATARGPEVTGFVDRLPTAARDVARGAIERMPTSLGEIVGALGDQRDRAVDAVGAAVAATGSLLFHAALMFIALYFFLVRGKECLEWLDGVSPLKPGQTHELFATFKKVSYAVMVATVATSAVQAIAALVGFVIAQVPNPFFFAVLTFFLAFVPAIGAAAVSLVAAVLLLATGHPYAAGFLAIWGVVVVGLVDNVVRPLLTRRGMEIHGAVVFFALLGGLAAFGAIGLLLGPLVVALFLALLRIYHRDFSPGDARVPSVPGLPAGDGAAPAAQRGSLA